ncbi:MAG: alpha/beta fold hydrolase [Gammaproteobacteria bacterium]
MTLIIPLPHEQHGASPLVMLHGLFGSATNFRSVAKRLSAKRPVYCLDLRNHGNADWEDDHTYPAMAADVINWMDTQCLDRVDLLGHSMGGKVAMATALTEPSRIRRLVSVDIAPVKYRSSLGEYVEVMHGIDLGSMKSRADVDKAMAEAIPEQGIRAFLLQNLKRGDQGMQWRINLEALQANMAAIAAYPDFGARSFDNPTLMLHGGRSDYVLERHKVAIYALFPRARIKTIDDAGHWVHAERPEQFVTEVEDFLDAEQ